MVDVGHAVKTDIEHTNVTDGINMIKYTKPKRDFKVVFDDYTGRSMIASMIRTRKSTRSTMRSMRRSRIR